MDWNLVIFNDIRLGQLVAWGGGLVAVLVLVRIYRSLFMRRKVNLAHMTYFVCPQCDWEGHISKFGTHCPRCNTPVESGEP